MENNNFHHHLDEHSAEDLTNGAGHDAQRLLPPLHNIPIPPPTIPHVYGMMNALFVPKQSPASPFGGMSQQDFYRSFAQSQQFQKFAPNVMPSAAPQARQGVAAAYPPGYFFPQQMMNAAFQQTMAVDDAEEANTNGSHRTTRSSSKKEENGEEKPKKTRRRKPKEEEEEEEEEPEQDDDDDGIEEPEYVSKVPESGIVLPKYPQTNLFKAVPDSVIQRIFQFFPVLPYYVSFSRVCKQWNNVLQTLCWNTVTTLNFSPLDMTSVTLENIESVLEKTKTNLTSLVFSDTSFDASVLTSLVNNVGATLETLVFAFCSFDAVAKLPEYLVQFTKLKHLVLVSSPDEEQEYKKANILKYLQLHPKAANQQLVIQLEWTHLSDEDLLELQTTIADLNQRMNTRFQINFTKYTKAAIFETLLSGGGIPNTRTIPKKEPKGKKKGAGGKRGRAQAAPATTVLTEEEMQQRTDQVKVSRVEYARNLLLLMSRVDISPNTQTFIEILGQDFGSNLDICKAFLRVGLNPNLQIGPEKNTVLHIILKEAKAIVDDWKKTYKEVQSFRQKNPREFLESKIIEWERKVKYVADDITCLLNYDADPFYRNGARKTALVLSQAIEKEMKPESILQPSRKKLKGDLRYFYPFTKDFFTSLYARYHPAVVPATPAKKRRAPRDAESRAKKQKTTKSESTKPEEEAEIKQNTAQPEISLQALQSLQQSLQNLPPGAEAQLLQLYQQINAAHAAESGAQVKNE